MAGLSLKAGVFAGGGTPVSAPAPTTQAPAVAAYGPAGTTVVAGGPGVLGTTTGHLAVYFGIACFVGLVLIRQSLPK